MTNEITTFNFDDQNVRIIVDEDGNPLFCAADVCAALGYGNSREALRKHCKAEGVTKCDTPTNSGIQSIVYIDERNLYRLVMRSKLESAERFQDWVCGEVLPTIRKTGGYGKQQPIAIPDYSNLTKLQILQMAVESEQQRIALENQNKGLQKQIEEDAPMVAFAQKVSDYGDAVLLDIAAKSVSMKPKEYWDAIRKLGWLRRDNHPMQFAIDRGYMKVRVFEVKHKSGMISYTYTPLICSKGQVKVAELCHFTFQKQQALF